ncbi:KTSC domain-containing protein [Sphingomonas mesophila]|uniref:KTSC domain-containing protein n=1 Tax=Sphingomonas mesophila TaxID=2303576 RepID=UPI000E576A92|nr:KTSC domain-containing protein [Sphingomonas mesophila]
MTSTAISGAWYLPAREELELLFTSGRRYRYHGVPANVAERFAMALSKGQFFNHEIRDRYRCRELIADLPQVA